MSDAALSSQDLRSRAAVSTLQRTGAAQQEPDPLDLALRDRRKMLGLKVMEETVSESQTAAIKAENERLKAEIEKRQLQEAARATSPQDAWRDYIIKQVESLQGQLSEAQRAHSEAQVALLGERFKMVNDELARLQQAQAQPTDHIASALATINQAKALVEQVTPPPGPLQPPSTFDPALEKWKITAQMEHERNRMEFEERREHHQADLQLQREVEEKKLALERQRADRADRFFTEAAPKLMDLFQQLVQVVTQRGEATVMTGPASASTLPLGVERMQCQRCGGAVLYREDFGGVICPGCGAEYRPSREPAQSAPSEVTPNENGAPAAS